MLGLHTKSIEFSCWQTWGLGISTNLLETELLSTTNQERSLTVEQGPALPLWGWDSTVACLLQMWVQVPSAFALWKQKLPFRWVFSQSLKQWLGIHPLAQDSYVLSDKIALFFLDTVFSRVTGVGAVLVLTRWCTCNTAKVIKMASVTQLPVSRNARLPSCSKVRATTTLLLRSPRMNNKFAPGFATSKQRLSLRSVHPEPVSLPSHWPLVGLCYILTSLSAMSYYLKIICSLKICFIGL